MSRKSIIGQKDIWNVTKYAVSGVPQKRILMVDQERRVLTYGTTLEVTTHVGVDLAEIVEVRSGKNSDIFRSNLFSKLVGVNRCLSIVLPDKTIDLCFDNMQERDHLAYVLSLRRPSVYKRHAQKNFAQTKELVLQDMRQSLGKSSEGDNANEKTSHSHRKSETHHQRSKSIPKTACDAEFHDVEDVVISKPSRKQSMGRVEQQERCDKEKDQLNATITFGEKRKRPSLPFSTISINNGRLDFDKSSSAQQTPSALNSTNSSISLQGSLASSSQHSMDSDPLKPSKPKLRSHRRAEPPTARSLYMHANGAATQGESRRSSKVSTSRSEPHSRTPSLSKLPSLNLRRKSLDASAAAAAAAEDAKKHQNLRFHKRQASQGPSEGLPSTQDKQRDRLMKMDISLDERN